MREFNLFQPWQTKPEPIRYVGNHLRTIRERIIASYRDERYYDGDRNCGYGGYSYDGRWQVIAHFLMKEYELPEDAAILQLGCEKGFLLYDLKTNYPKTRIDGLEISSYAIDHSMPSIRNRIRLGSFIELPYPDSCFDLVLAIGVVYTLNLPDVIKCLKEINRVGKGRSFITLAAYETEEEFRLFRMWTVLGTTVLHKEEWREVMRHTDYCGDYKFTTAQSLNLVEIES